MDERGWKPVLEQLKQGNTRFLARVRANEPKRAKLAAGQQPIAIVLGCADSRVSPEIAFDTGLGKLFVVRVAGNVADTASIASIEYAVAHLGSRLIIVLAHQSCGPGGFGFPVPLAGSQFIPSASLSTISRTQATSSSLGSRRSKRPV